MRKYFIFFILFLSIDAIILSAQGNSTGADRPWKGNAILGNGNLCLVYSDDPRITAVTNSKGIQHFYFKDYATDYISSSGFELLNKNGTSFEGERKAKDSVGIESFFAALTRTCFDNGTIKDIRCYVHPSDAVILTLKTFKTSENLKYRFSLVLRKTYLSDKVTKLTSLNSEKNYALAIWENNTCIIAASKTPGVVIKAEDSTITITSDVSKTTKNEIILIAADSYTEAKTKLTALLNEKDLYVTASNHWNNWIKKGTVPVIKKGYPGADKYIDYYKRNLYAVKSACLNGNVPADMTGQFMTNGMPQLYPRDAMKSARVLLLTGHFEEAEDIIRFWTKPEIPKKNPGEFYARYDARAKAVDGGSGARFDEPEWDANGYFIQLVNEFNEKKKIQLADSSFIFELADFIAGNIDKSGLLYEGGIVEWTGYLPSTNMVCAAALKSAAQFAAAAGDKEREAKYLKANKNISASLIKTFDIKRNAYSAIRFYGVKAEDNRSLIEPTKDTMYLWDVTANFGVLWGYPNHKEMELTNKFYRENTLALRGGLQYFEATDNAGLSAYGSDVFFFTTAAAAQYQAKYGSSEFAKQHIDWMISNANSYGLMPERVFSNESNISDASPLTWCNAEFAAAVLEWSKKIK